MTTRKLYSEELVQLSESLEEMGNLVEASLKNLFFSIENKDMQLAERIVADDRNVNNLERSIEAQCLMLITTQQPIAQDLRTVSSILKVVTDIERIGDHASDIAELIQQMDHKQLERYSGHLQPMIAASREMVHEAVSAKHDTSCVRTKGYIIIAVDKALSPTPSVTRASMTFSRPTSRYIAHCPTIQTLTTRIWTMLTYTCATIRSYEYNLVVPFAFPNAKYHCAAPCSPVAR